MKKSKLSGNATKYLLQYSKLSCVFLLIRSGEAASEVVYVDIEPDVILANDDDQFEIDLNSDSFFDFHFYNRSNFFGGYWTSGSIYYIPLELRQRLQVKALEENSIAGSLVTFSTYSSGTIQRVFPYALESELINDAMQFQVAYYQNLVFSTVYYMFGISSVNGGNWYPEKLNHYLGVRFKDSDENTHYGWMRCDVKVEGRTLVIKDYAYESEPDYPIVAGDTAHYISINSLENTIEATVYSFGRDIYILTETIQNTEVIICNLNGQEVVRNFLQSENELINMSNYPAGTYLVTLLNGGKRYDKKIFIERTGRITGYNKSFAKWRRESYA